MRPSPGSAPETPFDLEPPPAPSPDHSPRLATRSPPGTGEQPRSRRRPGRARPAVRAGRQPPERAPGPRAPGGQLTGGAGRGVAERDGRHDEKQQAPAPAGPPDRGRDRGGTPRRRRARRAVDHRTVVDWRSRRYPCLLAGVCDGWYSTGGGYLPQARQAGRARHVPVQHHHPEGVAGC